MPQIQELDDVDDFDFELPQEPARPQPRQPAASSSRASTSSNPLAGLLNSLGGGPQIGNRTMTNNPEVFKQCVAELLLADAHSFQLIYPIYIDAKRPVKKGERRVPKSHAVAWPQAEQMAQACHALGFKTMLDYEGTHPRDWANPGRVRVLISDKGTPVHPIIKTKRALLMRIGEYLRSKNPLASAAPDQTAYAARYPWNSPAVSQGVLQQMLKPDMMEEAMKMSGMPMPPAAPGDDALLAAANKPAIGAPGRRQKKMVVRR